MKGARVNPDDLRRFAALLDNTATSMRKEKSSLNSSYNRLNNVWRDQKYHQFDNVYSQTLPQLEKFCKLCEQYAQFLRKKEKPLRRYQGQKY